MNATDALTKQERAVLTLVAHGWRNAKIAQELSISTRTVESHLYHIFDKLGVSSRTEAALYVLNIGSIMISEISNNSEDAPYKRGYSRDIRLSPAS